MENNSGSATVSKDVFYGTIIAFLAILLVVSVFTSGFGIVKPAVTTAPVVTAPTPSNPTPSNPTPTNPTPSAPQTLTVSKGVLPVLGQESAPVTIVEFSDFQCPFCGAAEGTNQAAVAYLKGRDPSYAPAVPKIETDYVNTGKVKLYFRDFPLVQLHPNAPLAAVAGRCANDQGKFWLMQKKLFATQEAWSDSSDPHATFTGYATEIGLNNATFATCLNSTRFDSAISSDISEGRSYGVQGTPGFFVIIPKNKISSSVLNSVVSANQFELFENSNEYVVFIAGAYSYPAFNDLLSKVTY
ncbi:thioredoxin domain-containing protein [Candidatus Micrarchaeota archaeon]|nr:thioredoxin domain-containing protein [Candidatus Micrarchaeota archaeon]